MAKSKRKHHHFSPTQVSVSQSSIAARSSGVRALVWVDMAPFLEKERGRCEKIAAELERAKQDLERFNTVWEPAYSRWFHSKFGEKVTRVRELEAKASELGDIVTGVETEALFTGCSERSVYARYEQMRSSAEKIDEMRSRQRDRDSSADAKAHEENHENPRDEGGNDELPPEIEEFLKMTFEQLIGRQRLSPAERARMFSSFKESFSEEVLGERRTSSGDHEEDERRGGRQRSRSKPNLNSKRPHPEETPEDLRRKQIYRALARQLHPDINADLTSREMDMWHEVRAAYEAKNLDQLETLAAMVESGGTAGYSKIGSLSRLRSIFQDFQRKLKAAQKTLWQAKKAPSWNFSETEKQANKLEELSRRIDHDLKRAIHGLDAAISDYERKIARWKVPTRPRQPRRSPKKYTPASNARPPSRENLRRPAKETTGSRNKAAMDAYTGFGRKGGA